MSSEAIQSRAAEAEALRKALASTAARTWARSWIG